MTVQYNTIFISIVSQRATLLRQAPRRLAYFLQEIVSVTSHKTIILQLSCENESISNLQLYKSVDFRKK